MLKPNAVQLVVGVVGLVVLPWGVYALTQGDVPAGALMIAASVLLLYLAEVR
jgi:hypothetical protein